jgi:hypothetical protein
MTSKLPEALTRVLLLSSYITPTPAGRVFLEKLESSSALQEIPNIS